MCGNARAFQNHHCRRSAGKELSSRLQLLQTGAVRDAKADETFKRPVDGTVRRGEGGL
jgi:hypothetical protein